MSTETKPMSKEDMQKVRQFLDGKATWAEVTGMTFDQAREIAQMACDLSALGRVKEARVLLEGLVACNPKDSASRAALGAVYQQLGMLPEAKEEFDAALSEDPANPVALGNRGELRLRMGDSQGIADLAQAVEKDPQGVTRAGRRSKAILTAVVMAAAQQGQQMQ